MKRIRGLGKIATLCPSCEALEVSIVAERVGFWLANCGTCSASFKVYKATHRSDFYEGRTSALSLR